MTGRREEAGGRRQEGGGRREQPGGRREEADFSLLRVSQGGTGILSWLGVSATGRSVRLEALEAEGMVEERTRGLPCQQRLPPLITVGRWQSLALELFPSLSSSVWLLSSNGSRPRAVRVQEQQDRHRLLDSPPDGPSFSTSLSTSAGQ